MTRLVVQQMGQTQSRSVQVRPQSLSDPPRSLRALLVLSGLHASGVQLPASLSLQVPLSPHAAPAGSLPERQRCRAQNLTPRIRLRVSARACCHRISSENRTRILCVLFIVLIKNSSRNTW
jgi:hypothetical protein